MKKSHIALLIGVAIVFIWSGINPHDRLTWWLEVFPAIIGLIGATCALLFDAVVARSTTRAIETTRMNSEARNPG